MLMSIRMPATFLPDIVTSFGHLSLGSSCVVFLLASHIARAAVKERSVILELGILGLNTTDSHMPPLGDTHFRFCLPRPLFCCPAITTMPSELGFSSASK